MKLDIYKNRGIIRMYKFLVLAQENRIDTLELIIFRTNIDLMENLPEQNDQKPSRITWAALWTDFLSVMNFERGVLYTLKGLLKNPKNTIDDYLYESRWNHANPMRLLLFSTALISFLNYYLVYQPNITADNFSISSEESYEVGKSLGKEFSEFEETVGIDIKKGPKLSDAEKEIKKKEATKMVMDKIFQYMDKFTFSLVPIFALFAFLFFRKSGYNYTENLVISALMISVINVIGILTVIPTMWSPIWVSAISSILIFVYTIYYFIDVYSVKTFGGFVKIISTVVLSYMVYMIIVFSVMLFFVLDMLTS